LLIRSVCPQNFIQHSTAWPTIGGFHSLSDRPFKFVSPFLKTSLLPDPENLRFVRPSPLGTVGDAWLRLLVSSGKAHCLNFMRRMPKSHELPSPHLPAIVRRSCGLPLRVFRRMDQTDSHEGCGDGSTSDTPATPQPSSSNTIDYWLLKSSWLSSQILISWDWFLAFRIESSWIKT
jgi:hypothetical protein